MTMKKYSILPRSSELESHHQMYFSVTRRTPLFGKGVLFFCDGCSQFILPRGWDRHLKKFWRNNSRNVRTIAIKIMTPVLINQCTIIIIIIIKTKTDRSENRKRHLLGNLFLTIPFFFNNKCHSLIRLGNTQRATWKDKLPYVYEWYQYICQKWKRIGNTDTNNKNIHLR